MNARAGASGARALVVFALVLFALVMVNPISAQAETRTLNLYFTHTGESAKITFKRNGRYVQSGLRELNRFLRDHRRNEPTRMDPELFDLVWEVYRASGARQPIHVVSAYRSPATNAMLRRTRGGQANKSQHTLGKAMDFFIPGIPATKLRELGFKLQGGGVGYYPKSATPFVHLDTGNVRAWPRMSRSQLTRLFPDGRTLHVPPDGRRLPGYEQALAAYNSRKRSGQVASFGRSRGSSGSGSDGGSGSGGGNLLANLFNRDRGNDNEAASTPRQTASAPSRARSTPAAAPATPRTLLAALPSSSLPVPSVAPRAQSGGVPVTITPQPAAPAPATAAPQPPATVPQAPATPAPVAEQAAEPVIANFEPPVPTRRPAVLVAAAEPPAIRQSAEEIERAVARRPDPVTGDAATAILAAVSPQAQPAVADTPAPSLLAGLPVPATRPALTGATEPIAPASNAPQILASYAPQPSARPTLDPATRPQARPQDASQIAALSPAATQPLGGKGARIAVPAPRPQEPDLTMTAALYAGAATTPKSARPSPSDAATARAPIVETEPLINPARFGPRNTTPQMLTAENQMIQRPDFAKNVERGAPSTVYTAGFTKRAPVDPNRLSGNAVTFLAVARVAGARGGDGQPLQLQIPATN